MRSHSLRVCWRVSFFFRPPQKSGSKSRRRIRDVILIGCDMNCLCQVSPADRPGPVPEAVASLLCRERILFAQGRSSTHSNLRFPAFPVFAAPQFVRFLVRADSAGPGVKVERAARSPGDVAEVAPERALDTLLDLRVRFSAVADAVEEVGKVRGVVAAALEGGKFLAIEVIDLAAVAGKDQITLVAVKIDPEPLALKTARVTTATFPCSGLVAEFVR